MRWVARLSCSRTDGFTLMFPLPFSNSGRNTWPTQCVLKWAHAYNNLPYLLFQTCWPCTVLPTRPLWFSCNMIKTNNKSHLCTLIYQKRLNIQTDDRRGNMVESLAQKSVCVKENIENYLKTSVEKCFLPGYTSLIWSVVGCILLSFPILYIYIMTNISLYGVFLYCLLIYLDILSLLLAVAK